MSRFFLQIVLYFMLFAHKESAGLNNVVDKQNISLRENYASFDLEENEKNEKNYYSYSKDSGKIINKLLKKDGCWMSMNAGKHISNMEKLEAKYAKARKSFREAVKTQNLQFNEMVLQNMIGSRGVASSAAMPSDNIPAGLNLGGYSMIRIPDSLLIFHCVKLRNNTRFRINFLETDLNNMRVRASVSLNDLHLEGLYERAWNTPGSQDPSQLYCAPTQGHAELLLQNVAYKLEGRLRLIGNNTYIVLTTSEINFPIGSITVKNNATDSQIQEVKKDSIDEFLDRMKSDLDEWLRDYLNEQLIFYKIDNALNDEIREYHQKRNEELNNYVETALVFIKTKLHQLNATDVKLPTFNIVSSVNFTLSDGVLRGLDSIHRRSVATGGMEDGIRRIDAIIGFSDLKAQYKYTTSLTTGGPPVSGMLMLSADDLTAHMSIGLVKEPATVDLNFDFIHHFKPESLTIQGPANRMTAKYKHLLKFHIVSIMSNGIYHNIRELQTLVKCHPNLFSYQSAETLQNSQMASDSEIDNPTQGTNTHTQGTSVKEHAT